MRIIEISALPNGAHNNQNKANGYIPDGWAVIPPDLAVPDTFPFVDLTVDGQMVVGMTAGVVPEPEPDPEVETTPTAQDDTDAMMVDHEYRLTLLELGVTEGV